jgi:sugar/nucleoside kinase (ribokinase family)
LKLLSVGNLTIDEIVSHSGLRWFAPGGSAFYSSVTASILGADAGTVSSIGLDYPQDVLDWMTKKKVDLRRIQKSNLVSTRFRLLYERGSRKVRLLSRGPRISSTTPIGNHDIIHLGPVYHEIDPEIAAVARRRCTFLSLDVQGLLRMTGSAGKVSLSKRNLDDYLSLCDAVKGSKEEARALTSNKNPINMVSELLKKGPKFAIVTLGSKGAILGSPQGILKVPAYPETSHPDATGAGDVLVGAWLVAFWRTKDPGWACAVGSAFASLIVRHSGRAKFRISRKELFRRAAWIYQRVSVVRDPLTYRVIPNT